MKWKCECEYENYDHTTHCGRCGAPCWTAQTGDVDVDSGFGESNGDGNGEGSGDGDGFGEGLGDGDGLGDGFCDGDGFGIGYGFGGGYGHGYGEGLGAQITTIGPYAVIEVFPGYIQVGCEIHSVDWWREHWTAVARRHKLHRRLDPAEVRRILGERRSCNEREMQV